MKFLVLMMVACLGQRSAPECSEDVACEFGSVCVEGTCSVVACSTSAQCDMEQFCSDGRCADGCAEAEDCYPGDTCDVDLAVCESAACEDTRRDCGFKEFCNAVSGECYEAGGYYCQPCNDDFDCGGNGNYCTGYGYCGVTCESDADCPSGFNCYPFSDINGNVQFYQCFTYCQLYENYQSDAGTKSALPVVLPQLPTSPEIEAGP